jgi:hypothetical protein
MYHVIFLSLADTRLLPDGACMYLNEVTTIQAGVPPCVGAVRLPRKAR